MNGNLGLSQAVGGLRIANPDDDDVNTVTAPTHLRSAARSPARPPLGVLHSPPASYLQDHAQTRYRPSAPSEDPATPPYHSNLSPDALNLPPNSTLEPFPRARSSPDTRLQHKTSSHMRQRSQDQYSAYPPGAEHPVQYFRNRAADFYAHPNQSTSSGRVSESAYGRLRAESTQSAGYPPKRSNSRSGSSAGVLPSSYPRSPTPVLHRQISEQSAHSSANLPRRSSRSAMSGQESGHVPSRYGDSAYAQEMGPLHSSDESKDKGAATSIQKTVDPETGRATTKTVKKGVRDFAFGRTLGEGSYSTVLAATDRQTSREYAIKVLDKRHIIKEKKVKYVNIEKDTLNRLTDHPGIVRLYYTFQDERSLYFVLDLATGGELLGVLKKMTTFDEDCTRFYGAQILDAIEYMHSKGVIHRDLKPENVLLDDQMHVKITDFGTAKLLDASEKAAFGAVSITNDPLDGSHRDRAMSFVGTAEYVSPELLTDKNACKASDLWALGCIIYQLLAGRPPFKAANEYLTFQKIVALEYTFPEGFPPLARDLVEKLLVLDPSQRLSIDAIKNHRFFEGIQWGKGLWKEMPPRLRSHVPYSHETARSAAPRGLDGPLPPLPKQAMPKSASAAAVLQTTSTRPQPRIITELAPPTQLDIDWSPILTRSNERILKLGNLVVNTAPAPISPTGRGGNAAEHAAEAPSKLSRFFGASANKKRQRLVMITSSARVVLAPSGGDKKEAKYIIDLTDPDVTWKSQPDAKGYTVWSIFTVSFRPPHALRSTLTPNPARQALHVRRPKSKHGRPRQQHALHPGMDGVHRGGKGICLYARHQQLVLQRLHQRPRGPDRPQPADAI